MSSAKFASITASLLARKGEAQPWKGVGAIETDKAALPWRSFMADRSLAAPPPPPPTKEKSCSVRMSAHDLERLSILAVKSGVTRQQVLKNALADFLAQKAQDYGCACLHNSMGTCNNDCGHPA